MDKTLRKYLEDLSARRIAPGGGSAAAVIGSVGASLNLMVIGYSVKENITRTEDKEFIVLRVKQGGSLDKLSVLIDEDCRAFSDLMNAISSGKNTKDTQEKYIRAATVPMDICRQCRESMEITIFLLENANRKLMTDVKCAAHILKAAFSSAAVNVLVNLKEIKDREFVRSMKDMLDQMRKEIEGMAAEIISGVRREDG